MAVVVACVGRPGGRVMGARSSPPVGSIAWSPTYAPSPVLWPWPPRWWEGTGANASPRVDPVDGVADHSRPLASLHANPAHSALRRVRHFDHAWTALGVAQSRYYPLPWDDRYCGAAAQAAMDASEGYDWARNRTMWSVR